MVRGIDLAFKTGCVPGSSVRPDTEIRQYVQGPRPALHPIGRVAAFHRASTFFQTTSNLDRDQGPVLHNTQRFGPTTISLAGTLYARHESDGVARASLCFDAERSAARSAAPHRPAVSNHSSWRTHRSQSPWWRTHEDGPCGEGTRHPWSCCEPHLQSLPSSGPC